MPPRFLSHAIPQPAHAGESLRRAREERHLSLRTVARETKLPIKHLQAIEAGDWESLPRGDYARYFMREYAKYLSLDPEPLLSEVAPGALPMQASQPARRPVDTTRAVHPMRRLLVLGILVLVLGYLVFAARVVLRPSELTLTSPEQDVATDQAVLIVSGVTVAGTEVTLNGAPVQVNERGRFSQEVPLQPGLNILTIVGKKGLSRAVTVVRRVLFTQPPADPGSSAPDLIP